MPDVPRDPRQLARDILSGKISIEDLAREQQRRRAAAGGPFPVPVKPVVQARPPIQNPVQPLSRPATRPAAFPPQHPAQRPAQRFPQTQQNQQRPLAMPSQQRPRRPILQTPSAQNRGPVFDRRPLPPLTQSTVAPAPAQSPSRARQITNENAYAAPSAIQDARSPIYNAQLNLRRLVRSRTALRQSMLMSEILGKPLALRDGMENP